MKMKFETVQMKIRRAVADDERAMLLAWSEGQAAAYLGKPVENPYSGQLHDEFEKGFEIADPLAGHATWSVAAWH